MMLCTHVIRKDVYNLKSNRLCLSFTYLILMYIYGALSLSPQLLLFTPSPTKQTNQNPIVYSFAQPD